MQMLKHQQAVAVGIYLVQNPSRHLVLPVVDHSVYTLYQKALLLLILFHQR
jgi:hypothetical protein